MLASSYHLHRAHTPCNIATAIIDNHHRHHNNKQTDRQIGHHVFVFSYIYISASQQLPLSHSTL